MLGIHRARRGISQNSLLCSRSGRPARRGADISHQPAQRAGRGWHRDGNAIKMEILDESMGFRVRNHQESFVLGPAAPCVPRAGPSLPSLLLCCWPQEAVVSFSFIPKSLFPLFSLLIKAHQVLPGFTNLLPSHCARLPPCPRSGESCKPPQVNPQCDNFPPV